jgi:formate dehydrogenase gamma subunit
MHAGLVLALWLAAAKPSAQADCLACHGDQDLKAGSGRSVYVDEGIRKTSVHGGFACADCHSGIKELPHPDRVPRVDCSSCHDDVTKPYRSSVHGTALQNGTPDAATCTSCHGPAHEILSHQDPASRVSKRNLPDTCGSCHANPDFLARHHIPFARPVEAYRLSIHGRAVAAGKEAAPSCSDCHGSHDILPARDAGSHINHWKVPETCGACHKEIAQTFAASVHGQAVSHGLSGAPVCTDCHGEHAILAPSEPRSLVNPARVSTVTCGRCHADERLAQKYNLSRDKVPAFADSYHGLALRSGSQTVANCASCHGVHNILPASDPRSSVHPTQLARTCGSCHPGAGTHFAVGPVHVRSATSSEHPVVRIIRVVYLVLIPLTLGFMALHNAADFLAKLMRGKPHRASGEEVPRMNLHFRIAHGMVVLSFPVLVVSGFALTFPDSWWAAPILAWEGRFALRGTIHRVAGVLLMAAIGYHGLHLLLSPRDRAILRHLWPRIQDAGDAWAMLRHNLGFSAERPLFGKFSYGEKAEYWAFVWGTVVMSVSGLLLWFNDFTLSHFPKWVSDASTALHFYEAVLAALSILVWHFYMVIFDPDVYPMDRSWVTGRTSADHLRQTRPGYYRELVEAEAAADPKAPAPPSKPPGEEPPSDQGGG